MNRTFNTVLVFTEGIRITPFYANHRSGTTYFRCHTEDYFGLVRAAFGYY